MGSPGERWGVTDFLLAHLADQADRAYQVAWMVGSQGKGRPPKTTPVPRPGMRERQRERPTFLRLVDDEGGELPETRGVGPEANAKALALLPGLSRD